MKTTRPGTAPTARRAQERHQQQVLIAPGLALFLAALALVGGGARDGSMIAIGWLVGPSLIVR